MNTQHSSPRKRGSNPTTALTDRIALLSHELNITITSYPPGPDEALQDANMRGRLQVLEAMVSGNQAGMEPAWRNAVADELDRIREHVTARRTAGFNARHGRSPATVQTEVPGV